MCQTGALCGVSNNGHNSLNSLKGLSVRDAMENGPFERGLRLAREEPLECGPGVRVSSRLSLSQRKRPKVAAGSGVP